MMKINNMEEIGFLLQEGTIKLIGQYLLRFWIKFKQNSINY